MRSQAVQLVDRRRLPPPINVKSDRLVGRSRGSIAVALPAVGHTRIHSSPILITPKIGIHQWRLQICSTAWVSI